MRLQPLAIAFFVAILSLLRLPARADDLQFALAPFEFRPPHSEVISIGSHINISKIDLTGQSITMNGSIRLDGSRKEIERYLSHEASLIKPFDIQGGILKITSISNIKIEPTKDFIAMEADFKTNFSPNNHHVSLKVTNGLFIWASSQAVLKIVPHSLQIKFADLQAMDYVERAAASAGAFVTGHSDVEFMSESSLQNTLDKYIDQAGIRKYLPQITELQYIKIGYNKNNDRVWVTSRVIAGFDKKTINSQLQALVDGAGVSEGRSVAEDLTKPAPSHLRKPTEVQFSTEK